MSPPLDVGPLSDVAMLVAAVAIGIGFGCCLERAGLGSARKLTGQFYLTDFTVFKVMFSAILTAMLGVFWLGWLGAIDVAHIYVPETYLIPQAIGGLLFGAGFVVAGLCPGTSCVAAASGRTDGLATAAGLFGGVMATGFAISYAPEFANSTSRGALTLPSVLHVSYGVVVASVVAIALGGFALAERIEKGGGAARSPYRATAPIAATPVPESSQREREVAQVSALELARWIRARRDGLRVVDLRTVEAFDQYHLPTAERARPESLTPAAFAPGDTVVFYGGDDGSSTRAATLIRGQASVSVYVLRGGVPAWIDEVLNPTRLEHPTAEEAEAFETIAQISRYFGGVPQVQPNEPQDRASSQRQSSSRWPANATAVVTPAATQNAVAVVRRRGC